MALRPVLGLLHVKPNVVDLAVEYMYWSLLGLWPRGAFNALDAYLQSQGTVWPQVPEKKKKKKEKRKEE